MAEPTTITVTEGLFLTEGLFWCEIEYGECIGDNQLATHARNMINTLVPNSRPQAPLRHPSCC